MGIQVVIIQPSPDHGAEVVSPSPGVQQLVARAGDATFIIQVPARIGGLADTAHFARNLAAAATKFGEWCEKQERSRTFPPTAQWPGRPGEH
jgi:hypothetical protein